jgi:hypothetical protein
LGKIIRVDELDESHAFEFIERHATDDFIWENPYVNFAVLSFAAFVAASRGEIFNRAGEPLAEEVYGLVNSCLNIATDELGLISPDEDPALLRTRQNVSLIIGHYLAEIITES